MSWYNLFLIIKFQLIKLDLDTCQIDQVDLGELWWHDGGNIEEIWATKMLKHFPVKKKMLKHFRFSKFDLISD